MQKRVGRKPRPMTAMEMAIKDESLNKMLAHIMDVTKKNEAELLRGWITNEYKKTVDFSLKVGEQKVMYFVEKKEMEDTAALIEEYRQKGLVVDEQLIQYLSEKNNGVII